MSEVAGMVGGHSGKAVLDGGAVAQLRAELLAYLTRLTADRTLAEDLAQEAMVRAIQALPAFRGAAALRTWVRRIAQNVWRDHQRRRAASPAERAAGGDPFSVGALLDSIGPVAPGLPPDDAYDRRVTHDCLLAAARRLPRGEREVVLLHDLGAIALERPAELLGCSVGAAKVRLHRARRRLAALCRAECTSENGPDGTTLCSPIVAAVPVEIAPPAARRNDRTRRE